MGQTLGARSIGAVVGLAGALAVGFGAHWLAAAWDGAWPASHAAVAWLGELRVVGLPIEWLGLPAGAATGWALGRRARRQPLAIGLAVGGLAPVFGAIAIYVWVATSLVIKPGPLGPVAGPLVVPMEPALIALVGLFPISLVVVAPVAIAGALVIGALTRQPGSSSENRG
jgi:hypothetical protein